MRKDSCLPIEEEDYSPSLFVMGKQAQQEEVTFLNADAASMSKPLFT